MLVGGVGAKAKAKAPLIRPLGTFSRKREKGGRHYLANGQSKAEGQIEVQRPVGKANSRSTEQPKQLAAEAASSAAVRQKMPK